MSQKDGETVKDVRRRRATSGVRESRKSSNENMTFVTAMNMHSLVFVLFISSIWIYSFSCDTGPLSRSIELTRLDEL